MTDHQTPLTSHATVGEWLDHPVGGPLLRDLVAAGGQDASSLAPARSLPLGKLVELSGGKLPAAAVEQLVRGANGGELPEEETAPQPGPATPVAGARFAGRTAIVTGAASGIGRATAERLLAEGARVVAVDLVADRLADIAPGSGELVTVAGDITDPEAVARIVDAAGDRIDALANVAGVMDDMTPLHEVSDAVWRRVMSVNVDGTFLLSRAVLPSMLAAGSGSIVNVTSEAGLRGSAAGFAYTTSKHAVVGMTKSAAFMYSHLGVRVNAVAPGPVATGIQATFASELGSDRIKKGMVLLPAVATPESLAASIVFLLSDDASNVSGAILPSDGGWSAQ